MDFFLSSPTSTSLVSSPGLEPNSTIIENEGTYQDTAITSPGPTDRSRHTKSEQHHETSVSQAENSPQSEGTIQVGLQEPSEVYYATTFTTNAVGILLEPDQSLFTQTRVPGSFSASEARSSSSSSSSSGSPLALPTLFRGMTPSTNDLDDDKEDAETVGEDIRQASWPLSAAVTDDGEGSLASFSTVSLSSTTDSNSTMTPTPRTPARFTAEEKGKAVDRSGREWARNIEEKRVQRKDADEMEPQPKHKRTKSTGTTLGVEDATLRSVKSLKERSHRRSTSDHDIRYRRRRKVTQEDGLSRDFVLIIALCVGFACAGILIVRPAAMVLNHNHGDGFDLFFDI